MQVSGPISAIICTLILVASFALIGSDPPHTYATVRFDGGYTKLGYIGSERVYTEGEIVFDGEVIADGDFDELRAWIHDSLDEGESIESVTWVEGVHLTGKAGVKWVASESNFNLQTDALDLRSDGALSLANAIAALDRIEADARQGREATANEALSYGPAPGGSFAISKLLNMLGNL